MLRYTQKLRSKIGICVRVAGAGAGRQIACRQGFGSVSGVLQRHSALECRGCHTAVTSKIQTSKLKPAIVDTMYNSSGVSVYNMRLNISNCALGHCVGRGFSSQIRVATSVFSQRSEPSGRSAKQSSIVDLDENDYAYTGHTMQELDISEHHIDSCGQMSSLNATAEALMLSTMHPIHADTHADIQTILPHDGWSTHETMELVHSPTNTATHTSAGAGAGAGAVADELDYAYADDTFKDFDAHISHLERVDDAQSTPVDVDGHIIMSGAIEDAHAEALEMLAHGGKSVLETAQRINWEPSVMTHASAAELDYAYADDKLKNFDAHVNHLQRVDAHTVPVDVDVDVDFDGHIIMSDAVEDAHAEALEMLAHGGKSIIEAGVPRTDVHWASDVSQHTPSTIELDYAYADHEANRALRQESHLERFHRLQTETSIDVDDAHIMAPVADAEAHNSVTEVLTHSGHSIVEVSIDSEWVPPSSSTAELQYAFAEKTMNEAETLEQYSHHAVDTDAGESKSDGHVFIPDSKHTHERALEVLAQGGKSILESFTYRASQTMPAATQTLKLQSVTLRQMFSTHVDRSSGSDFHHNNAGRHPTSRAAADRMSSVDSHTYAGTHQNMDEFDVNEHPLGLSTRDNEHLVDDRVLFPEGDDGLNEALDSLSKDGWSALDATSASDARRAGRDWTSHSDVDVDDEDAWSFESDGDFGSNTSVLDQLDQVLATKLANGKPMFPLYMRDELRETVLRRLLHLPDEHEPIDEAKLASLAESKLSATSGVRLYRTVLHSAVDMTNTEEDAIRLIHPDAPEVGSQIKVSEFPESIKLRPKSDICTVAARELRRNHNGQFVLVLTLRFFIGQPITFKVEQILGV
jgi:hypothetical protein